MGLSIVAILLALLVSGCGGSGSNLSQSQAAGVAGDVEATALDSYAMALAQTGPTRLADKLINRLKARNAHAAEITSNSPDQSCTPTSCSFGPTTVACDVSGNVSVTGTFMGSDNGTTTTYSYNATETPAACLETSGDLTLESGTITQALDNVSFNDSTGAVSYPITLTTTGNISYGPSPSGNCSINETITLSSESSGTISGNVCGYSVSGNF